MTGESEERKKDSFENCMRRFGGKGDKTFLKTFSTEAHSLPSPMLLSGTHVASGSGKMISIVVGECSALGEIMKRVVAVPEETPLQ